MTNSEIKLLINKAYEAADVINATPYGEYFRSKGIASFSQLLQLDLIRYVTYLANIKGYATEREVVFYKDCYNAPVGGIRQAQAVMDSNFEGEDFADTVPFLLSAYLLIDIELCNNGIDPNGTASKLYVDLFESVGRCFVEYHGKVDPQEQLAMNRFIALLRNARMEKLSGLITEDSVPDSPTTDSQKNDKCEDGNSAIDEDSLEQLLAELDALVGMESVKNEVHSLINLTRIREIKKQRGLPQNDVSLHMVFLGNPGTGKTTVARLISKIYRKLGVLSKGHLIEVDRSGMVAGYVGQTALKVKEKITEAHGGILFIDEAYALTANRDSSDFGFEAVDTLLKGMEDYRDDFVVIVAGYPAPMAEFLESNPGLKSRFNKFITFDDYNPDELMSIFISMCKKAGFIVSDSAHGIVEDYFVRMYENRGNNFANGRDVRNFFETAVVNQANRLAQYNTLSDNDLITLEEIDFQNVIAQQPL